jgi:hypothetical protein
MQPALPVGGGTAAACETSCRRTTGRAVLSPGISSRRQTSIRSFCSRHQAQNSRDAPIDLNGPAHHVQHADECSARVGFQAPEVQILSRLLSRRAPYSVP